MERLRNVLSIGVILAILFLGTPALYAGDDEWADAGKILAGVVGGVVGYHILSNMSGGYGYRDGCYEPCRRVYRAPVVYCDSYYDDCCYEYETGYVRGYERGYRQGYRRGRREMPVYRRKVVRYYYY